MKKYKAIVKKWFDKINGNTYHSVLILDIKETKEIAYSSMVYGYGCQYEQTAAELLNLTLLETRKVVDFEVSQVRRESQLKHK